MRRFLAFSVVALVGVLVTACSDASTSVTCTQQPTLAPPQLLYPIPGAVNVPDNAQILVVGNVGPASGSLNVIPPSGTAIAALPLGAVPSPAPSPAVSPGPTSNPQAAVIPTLAAATTYSVQFQANSVVGCSAQGQSSGIIGSFTTQ
jgi:hypothetical protein